jgi:HEAT repeat protein
MTRDLAPLKSLLLGCIPALFTGCSNPRKTDYSVASLRETLRNDKDPNMRYYAAESLGKFGDRAAEAVPDLIEALRDEDKMVRMGAGYALAELGAAAGDAVPALQEATKDPAPEVRDAATSALKQIRQKGTKR